MLRFLIFSISIICSSTVSAQNTDLQQAPAITNEDIELQRQTIQSVIEEADNIRNDPNLTQSLDRDRELIHEIHTDGLRGLINSLTDGPDRSGQKKLIDSILAAGQSKADMGNSNGYNPMNPLILVSFSMPEDILISALEEAKRLEAAVYLRGFLNDDVNQTIDRLVELSSKSDYALSIDPTVFTRFNVESVPAYILPVEPVIPCGDSGCTTPTHARATGAAGLQYFLDLVKRTGMPAEKNAATTWLESVDHE